MSCGHRRPSNATELFRRWKSGCCGSWKRLTARSLRSLTTRGHEAPSPRGRRSTERPPSATSRTLEIRQYRNRSPAQYPDCTEANLSVSQKFGLPIFGRRTTLRTLNCAPIDTCSARSPLITSQESEDRMLRIPGRPRAGRRLVVALALMAPLVGFVFASSAAATPKGVFSVFSDCPTENPEVALCVYGLTTSGEFVIGSSKVPINQTITLQGGAVWTGNEENHKEYDLIPPKDGKILSETALNVPGGLAGLINCEEIKGSGLLEIAARALCKEVFEGSVTGVTAQTEPVNTTSNPIVLNLVHLALEEGVAVKLPVRVHLK